MATKQLQYDHPTYITPYIFSGNTTVGANGVSQKFAAFTAMKIKACLTSPTIASTAAGSQPLLYSISGTTTATATLTALTSAARTPLLNALATPVTLAQGDQFYVTHGTDATASLCVALECYVTPGAVLTA